MGRAARASSLGHRRGHDLAQPSPARMGRGGEHVAQTDSRNPGRASSRGPHMGARMGRPVVAWARGAGLMACPIGGEAGGLIRGPNPWAGLIGGRWSRAGRGGVVSGWAGRGRGGGVVSGWAWWRGLGGPWWRGLVDHQGGHMWARAARISGARGGGAWWSSVARVLPRGVGGRQGVRGASARHNVQIFG